MNKFPEKETDYVNWFHKDVFVLLVDSINCYITSEKFVIVCDLVDVRLV